MSEINLEALNYVLTSRLGLRELRRLFSDLDDQTMVNQLYIQEVELEKLLWKINRDQEQRHKLETLVAWIIQNRTDIKIGDFEISPQIRPKEQRWRYYDFEVGIKKQEGLGPQEYLVSVNQTQWGESYEAITTIAPSTDEAIQKGILSLKHSNPADDVIVKLGKRLFELLMPEGKINESYRKTLQMASERQQGWGLRMKLQIDPPELQNVPWEYLYDSKLQKFLAFGAGVVLSRKPKIDESIRFAKRRQIPELPQPLRILLIQSSPEGVESLNLIEEYDSIVSTILPSKQIEVVPLLHPTHNAIRDALRNNIYHIIHYSGHGYFSDKDNWINRQYMSKNTSHIVLPDKDNQAQYYGVEKFAAFFNQSPQIRLVILNACNLGFAEELIRIDSIHAVITMQFPITNKAAGVFAGDFYKSLVAGLPMDAAILEARKALYFRDIEHKEDSRAWGAPILYMRLHDGRLYANRKS